MAEYKVILRNDLESNDVLWEPGCPLLVKAIQVSRNAETGQAFLQTKIWNITSNEVKSFVARFTISYENENDQIIDINLLDADLPAGEIKNLKPFELKHGDVASLNYRIISSKTGNGDWHMSNQAELIHNDTIKELSAEASKERKTLLEEAGFANLSKAAKNAVVDAGEWWICICGTPNVGVETCIACGSNKDYLKKLESESFLEDSVKRRRAKAEEETRKKAQLKAKKKKALKIAISSVIAALIVLFAIAWITVLAPKMEYESAIQLYNEGNFAEASAKFTKLGNYESAPDWAEKANYQSNLSNADSLRESGDLLGALQTYESIGDTESYIQKTLRSMAEYVKAHASTNDKLTIAYLDVLREYNYDESNTLLGLVYPWTYEFSLTSSKSFKDSGKQWTTDSTIKKSVYDTPILLVRANCEIPDAKKYLDVVWEGRSTGISSRGKWTKKDDDSYSAKVWGDAKICSFYGGNVSYSDGWRVTVTDPITNNVLYTSEIFFE